MVEDLLGAGGGWLVGEGRVGYFYGFLVGPIWERVLLRECEVVWLRVGVK